jgi:hypothetical protein
MLEKRPCFLEEWSQEHLLIGRDGGRTCRTTLTASDQPLAPSGRNDLEESQGDKIHGLAGQYC